MTYSADVDRIKAETSRMAAQDEKKINQAADDNSDEFDALDTLADESGVDLFDSMNIPEGK
jgi:hypothetical protein